MPKLKSPHATSIASWSLALADTLKIYDHNPNEIFSEAGINLSKITSPYDRLPVSCVQKIWKFAAENTDEYFGIKVAEHLNIASFHALGFALASSSTLKELIERLIRYRCVISHMHFAELIEYEGNYLYNVIDERNIKTNITDDTLFAFILRLAKNFHSPDFKPLRVKLNRSPKISASKLSDLIGAPIEFGAPENGILFSKKQLRQPLRFGNRALAEKQDIITEQYIAELGLISEYMLRVKNEISSLLEQGDISLSGVAKNLNITSRTLQRRLSDENSSYHDLLDKVRYELTMNYIADTNLNATEIAFKLGFSDSSSFSRSFKRWTKQSFISYRKDRLNRKKSREGTELE